MECELLDIRTCIHCLLNLKCDYSNSLNTPHTYIPLLYVHMCLHSATYIYIYREEYFCIIIVLSVYCISVCNSDLLYNSLIVLLL